MISRSLILQILQAAKIMRRFFYEAPAEIMRNYTTDRDKRYYKREREKIVRKRIWVFIREKEKKTRRGGVVIEIEIEVEVVIEIEIEIEVEVVVEVEVKVEVEVEIDR